MAKDIRERRAERVKQGQLKRTAKNYQWGILGIVGIVLLVAVVALNPGLIPGPPPSKKTVHEHAAFAWYVEGEHVSFRHPAYDFSSGYNDVVHMHYSGQEADNNDVLHIEGSYVAGIPSWSLKRIFEQYGLKVAQSDITLDRLDSHNGSRWVDSGNLTWHFLVSKQAENEARQPFAPLTGDYTGYIPRDRDKILLTYGNPTPTELAGEEQGIQDGPWTPTGPPSG